MTMNEIEKKTRLNLHGVKDSADMWRTIKGHHYICWAICPEQGLIVAYRAAGVRCALRGEELFVHHEDKAKAAVVDVEYEKDNG